MNKTIKALLLALPALILLSFIYLATDFTYDSFIGDTAIANILLSEKTAGLAPESNTDTQADTDVIDLPDEIVKSDKTLPVIAYASKWATLNINGWEEKDIPVHLGDKEDILSTGAGQWIGSYFCGLGKNCIVTANAATYFYELEDTAIGTSVTMKTIYGDYEYEVVDKYTFDKADIDMLYEDTGEDTLILHTSYPRSGASAESEKRIALICTLKRGTLFQNKFDT